MNINEFRNKYGLMLVQLTSSELEKLYWDVQLELDRREMLDKQINMLLEDYDTKESKL